MKAFKVMVTEIIRTGCGYDTITSEYSGEIKMTKASARREMLWARNEGYDAKIVEIEVD